MKNRHLAQALALFLALALTAAGCAPASQPETTPVPTSSAPAAETPAPEAEGVSGTFTGTAQGFGGEVSVTLTLENGVLAEVSAVGEGETAGVGSRAIELMPGSMKAAGSIEVDGVSGATVTSSAVLAAAADALAQSGASLSGSQPMTVQQSMTPGTYYGEAYGKWAAGTIEGERFGSPAVIEPTKVSVTVDETSILSVEVLSTSDTPGFTDPCIERIPAAIVENQSVAVDVVTGATLTSQAILSGVTQALTEAGADLAGFSAAPAVSTAAETYEADVVIVGAGAAGTMAALTAVEQGLNVVVLEKTGKVGGTSVCSTGFAAVGSDLQKEAGNTRNIDETFTYLMNYCLWRADASVVYNVLQNSADTVNTIQGYWAQTDNPGVTKVSAPRWAHDTGKGTAKFDVLYDNFLEPAGVNVMLETTAHTLLMDGEAVTGVVATRQDGAEVTVNAQAVLVCTGGFGGNKEMLEEYFGHSHFYLNGLSSNVGDGLNMCLEAGAILSDEVEPHLAEFCSSEKLDFYAGYMKFINQAGFLALDPSGERFVNEEFFVTEALAKGASALRRAGYAYIIFTEQDLNNMVEKGLWGILSEETIASLNYRARIVVPSYYTLRDELDAALAAGEAWTADTLEGLGEAIGLDAATYNASIEDYLTVLETKEDPLFGKRTDMMPSLSEGPYYAVRVVSAIDGTYNGIRVNKHMQAIGQDYQPISGLYVAGQDSGGFFSYPYYEGEGWTQGYAWTSGRIAGKAIAGQVK